MFKPERFTATPHHRRIYSRYEKIYTAVDFTAAMTFVIGSILFFYPKLVVDGTWLFLLGSICFAVRPTVRLLRELHLAALPLPREDDG